MNVYNRTKEFLWEEPRDCARKAAIRYIIDESYYNDKNGFDYQVFDASIDWLAEDIGDWPPSIHKGTVNLVINEEGPDYNELFDFKKQTTHYLTLIKQGLDGNVLELDHLKKLFEIANIYEEEFKKFLGMGA